MARVVSGSPVQMMIHLVTCRTDSKCRFKLWLEPLYSDARRVKSKM